MAHDYQRQIGDEERRAFLKAFGVAGSAALVGELTLGELRDEVTVEATGELASTGERIRGDLVGSLDAGLLAGETTALAAEFDGVEELAATGLPDEPGSDFEALTDAAWPIVEHLAEVGFFASAERHLPPFVPEHIVQTTKQLIASDALGGTLAGVGFTEAELTGMVVDVVNDNQYLARWKPTAAYAAQGVDDFDPADIAPLHQRATEGALLWIDGLDWWLWQNEVLVTEELLAAGVADVKAMLGGVYLVADAARRVAEGDITDEALAATVTAGSAVSIVNQENLANDLIRIPDEKRAPRGGV